MTFLHDVMAQSSVSYHSLLQQISELDKLQDVIHENNLSVFYTKLVANLINNVDSILVDDVTASKGTCFDVEYFENKSKGFFEDQWNESDIISKVLNSKSSISIFTSGTTGTPKKITHAVNKFVDMTRRGEKYEENTWAFLYNPVHMAGLQVFFQAFLNKNTLFNLFRCDRITFIKTCKEQNITNISATPTFFRLLYPFDFKIDSIKRCTLGGEKSDESLIENLKNSFPNAKINNIYASTEAGSIFISKGESFKLIPELKDKIKFENNEIVLHKSLLGSFYDQEWFYTGDLVEFTDDSQTVFKILSRNKDYVNIGGNRVNLLEVEGEVRKVEGVLNALVYSQKNSVLGSILTCDVVSAKEYTKKEFKDILKEKLQPYKVPTKINFVEKLETTRTGKLQRIL